MATTLTVQDSVTFAQTLIVNQKLNINNFHPGLDFANIILQRILGPPFIWRFNRANYSFSVSTAAGTDYALYLPNLGRIETQWLVDDSSKIHALSGAVSLPKTSSSRRPKEVAPVYDDNAGNITFRLDSIPDQAYQLNMDCQQKPGVISSPAEPWGVVPDEFSYIFKLGFLSMAGMLVKDARFPIWEKDFIASLLGAQDGLDEQAKNIFIGDWMNTMRTIARNQGAGQAGTAGRGQ